MLPLLIFALISDTAAIYTTIADSSRIDFIAQTPLLWKTVEHDSLRYIRFTDSPLCDSIGYPQLPMITCLVAFPDSVTPELEFAFSDVREQIVNPVYPAPAQVFSTSQYQTASIVDSFVQDSTAYVSDEFWPAERVRIIGETRISDQRLLQIQLFPAQYRASDSTLSTVSNFSVSLAFDSSSAIWSEYGLGVFQRMVEGSPILGNHRRDQQHAPVPTYFGKIDTEDLEDGPSRMPDYLIICASGLYTQCSTAIDALANHRVTLNNFDVALVTTDDIFDEFGTGLTLDDVDIRAFTQHVSEEWGNGKPPSYLLLIGDHEDEEYHDEPWFLPTHVYQDIIGPDVVNNIGNDEWYTYFSQPTSVNNAFPEMMVGRLSVKNGAGLATDTLSELIYNLINLEDPITGTPITDYRRRVLRFSGTGNDDGDTALQVYGIDNTPEREWSRDFVTGIGYSYFSPYCGDGRCFSNTDESIMQSKGWVRDCLIEFAKGAGVAIYTDHGELHMFSAGLEWWPRYIEDYPLTKGARDSTFNNYQIDENLQNTVTGYSAPFNLLLDCSNGTFNHTLHDHQTRRSHTYFCFNDDGETSPRSYDFGSDCLAEKILKNTNVPVAGIFCSSQPSVMVYYEFYGKGILEAIYVRGFGRLGDAIASSRFLYKDYFITSNGLGVLALGQFNLLGDPALDISDRVRYPNKCDLLVYGGDVNISEYPIVGSSTTTLPFSFTIRNIGAQDTPSSFNTEVTFSNGLNSTVIDVTCGEIVAGESREYTETWTCPIWFNPPMGIDIAIVADSDTDCSDSWRGNNTSVHTIQLNDTYVVDANWIENGRPKPVDLIVNTTPLLVNLDSDAQLEVVVLTGTTLSAFEHDGSTKWTLSSENFTQGGQPLAVDLDDDGKSELILASNEGIKVIDPYGDVLHTMELTSSTFTVGDMMDPTTDLELCAAVDETLYLYKWDTDRDRFIFEKSKTFSLPGTRMPASICCADLGSSSFADVSYCTIPSEIGTSTIDLTVYDWETPEELFSYEWARTGVAGNPAVGELAGTKLVGFPFGSYDESSQYPAMLIEPDGIIEEDCAKGDVDAGQLKYGVFADWVTGSGADTFVLPSEMQCFAWNDEGDPYDLNNWPTEEYSGAIQNSSVSPTALGDLDNTTNTDVLFSTIGKLFAFDSDGYLLSGFPVILPDDINALGGFAIADIDRDGIVEIVFGTSDGYLHVWELGTCTTGYAPWPQFQHDAGRTGVLE